MAVAYHNRVIEVTSAVQADKGPLIDISMLGDPVPIQPEVRKRRRDSADREEDPKAKKSKKEKKPKKEKSEKVRVPPCP